VLVSGTHWWPPFCATVDVVIAVTIVADVRRGGDDRDRAVNVW
jgi:hypothetical protein